MCKLQPHIREVQRVLNLQHFRFEMLLIKNVHTFMLHYKRLGSYCTVKETRY